MINFFESVTMNPLGKAMDIIYLDFEQATKRAGMVLPVKYLIGYQIAVATGRKQQMVTLPDQCDGQRASQSHGGPTGAIPGKIRNEKV